MERLHNQMDERGLNFMRTVVYRLMLVAIALISMNSLAWSESAPDPELEAGQAELVPEVRFIPSIQVDVPFIELRSGPAHGYPVTNIAQRGEWLQITIRKTQWVKVVNRKLESGWIHIDDLLLMKDGTGNKVSLVEPKFDDFNTRQWEFGLMSGEFDRSSLVAANAGIWFTSNIAAELTVEQVLSSSSELLIIGANLSHQPFPEWRLSPYFSLGAGKLFIKPKASLSEAEKRSEELMNVGIGLRYYISNRYFIRAEVRDYKVFTSRETNEEATEWKIGLSVFF